MVDSAKRLHRRRCQSDLIADSGAVLAVEKADVSLLNIVGVGDGRRRIRRTKPLEPRIGLVFGKQLFGCAPGRDVLHGLSPFS
jgi:hypothetical protein